MFFLQAVSGSEVCSVRLDKDQVRVLAERSLDVLDQTRNRDPLSGIPAEVGDEDLAGLGLSNPVAEEFVVGAMGIGWNTITKRLVIEAHDASGGIDVPDVESDTDDGPDTLRVRLTGAQARAFAHHALAVVAAGRPECPFCHEALDPDGHVCPRANGYRR